MLLKTSIQSAVLARFREHVPYRTGNLKFNACKIVPIVGYDSFGILYDSVVAPYGHWLEVNDEGRARVGGRGSNVFTTYPNKHKGWFSKRALPAALDELAKQLGGKIIY